MEAGVDTNRRVLRESRVGLAVAAGVGAALLYAGQFVISRWSFQRTLTPWDLAAIRFVVAGSLLLPIVLRHGLRDAAGIGWGSGKAVVVNCECELARVGHGDILVTRVAGPALSHILPRVAGVVAELGGSTSHMASLARERGIPMVLGVLDATRKIPDGVQCAVDGVAGIVRWQR